MTNRCCPPISVNQSCFSLPVIVWIPLRILENIKYVKLTINHRIYLDNGPRVVYCSVFRMRIFMNLLAGTVQEDQTPGSHSAIDWSVGCDGDRREECRGGRGVGGVRRQ